MRSIKSLWPLSAGVFVLAVRAALLPIWPMPVPTIYDEFSYLLQADTFAHERLTNPTHPMWPFFESIYILQKPSYASKYPPGQSLAMAAGQVLLKNPWWGVWLSCGILAAALCWAFEGWLPDKWALLGVAMAIQLCAFSYWMNSYWGGAVTALGGALVTGAYGRMRNRDRPRLGWVLGLGIVILMLTRPFEGLLLTLPVLIALRRTRGLVPAVACVAAGLCWLGFYDYRVTGNALRMPYQEYFSQYETAPPFNVLPLAPSTTRTFRHFDLEWMNSGWALDTYSKARSRHFPAIRLHDWYTALKLILGNPLWIIPLLGFAPLWFRSNETRPLAWLTVWMMAGSAISVCYYPHYAAPFTAVILILGVVSVRRLGSLASLAIVFILGITLWTDASQIYHRATPDTVRAANGKKEEVEKTLIARGTRRHVIFVRYTGTHSPHAEWIYNAADIDASPVVWAQDMGGERNRELLRYFAGREFWLFQPDDSPDNLAPYSP